MTGRGKIISFRLPFVNLCTRQRGTWISWGEQDTLPGGGLRGGMKVNLLNELGMVRTDPTPPLPPLLTHASNYRSDERCQIERRVHRSTLVGQCVVSFRHSLGLNIWQVKQNTNLIKNQSIVGKENKNSVDRYQSNDASRFNEWTVAIFKPAHHYVK